MEENEEHRQDADANQTQQQQIQPMLHVQLHSLLEDEADGHADIIFQDNLSYTELLKGNIVYKDQQEPPNGLLPSCIITGARNEVENGTHFRRDRHEEMACRTTPHAQHHQHCNTAPMGDQLLTLSDLRAEEPNANRWSSPIFDQMKLPGVTENFNETESDTHFGAKANNSDSGSKTVELGGAEEDMQDDSIGEQDIENFLENERKAAEEGDNYNIDSDLKPHKGMKFETKEKAQDFFNFYSYVAGFSVAIVSHYRTASRKRNNEIIRVTMKCNKHARSAEKEKGQVVAQRQSTVIARTNCKVEMVICERNAVWEITSLHLEHDHPLSPHSRFFRSHAYISEEEKELIRTLKKTNTPTRGIVAILAYIRGGMKQLPYNKKKVSNYATSINKEEENNDMMEALDFFNKKQAENPGFYYSFELDGDNKVRSMFWADSRSRIYYDVCGDCISFDTTFLTNKYNLPFAPFVGVSPHGNTYLFACAFIVDETSNTFKWLFRQFLTAMGGKHPQSIITDQDKAMQNAIGEVFPNTTHRTCLFHIKKKAEEKIGTCFQANQGLYEEFQDIIDNSLTEDEFETHWQEMIATFEVEHIKYFSDMWKSRHRFIPVYFKTNFFPFLQTTARSEGMNALFKKGVGAKFSITSFLREYQRILDTIHAREDECDHNTSNKKVSEKKYWSKYFIERQAHNLYNLGIFRKFQKKLEDVTRLQLLEQQAGKEYLVFQALNYPIKEHRQRHFLVQVDLGLEEYSCICCMFQKDGILCSHILKVMLHLNVEKIPEKYIIERWRKKDKKIVKTAPPQIDTDSSSLRFNVLSRKFVVVASSGSKTKAKYNYLLQEIPRLEEGMAQLDIQEEANSAEHSNNARTITSETILEHGESSDGTIQMQDPNKAHTKGRPRMMTIRERIKENKFYKCSHCNGNDHTYRKCPNKHLQFDKPRRRRGKNTNPRNTGKKNNKEEASNVCTSSKSRSSTPKKRKTAVQSLEGNGNEEGNDAAFET